MSGRIVVLNGVGSAGKSRLAREIQMQARGVVLHAAMDAFLEMLPEALQDGPEGFAYLPGPEGVTVVAGPAGQRLMAAMMGAVAALAGTGDSVVFDAVLTADQIAGCRKVFAGFRPVFIALTAPLPVLEAREAARGDRMIGLARAQHSWMHHGVSYDLTLDSAAMGAAEAARSVCERFDL